MRVAYICWAPFISGAERSLQTTLRSVNLVGVEPVVLCPADSKFLPWCHEHGFSSQVAPLGRRDRWHPVRWWKTVHTLKAILRGQRVDLVHSNQLWSYQAIGAAAAQLGIPRVCHMRDEACPETVRWYCHYGVESAICISRHIESLVSKAWQQGSRRPHIQTILNPVLPIPDSQREHGAELKMESRRKLGLNSDTTVFGFIGQIAPIKGLPDLIDAVSGLGAKEWQLLIAGRDPQPGAPHEQLCRDKVAELGLHDRVRFLGFQDDPSGFYHAIDLAVVPSLEEPLGRIPWEAASYGKPSVAYAVGGLPETIQHGKTGWLVRPRDVTGLRSVLQDFCTGRSTTIGEAARTWVDEVANPQAYVRKLAGLYESLIAPAATEVA